MKNYSIYLETESEKYDFISKARQAGAVITGVSGCGTGYYIQIDATPEQVDYLNRILYTKEIDRMNAGQVLAAWHAGILTMQNVLDWQKYHGEVL